MRRTLHDAGRFAELLIGLVALYLLIEIGFPLFVHWLGGAVE